MATIQARDTETATRPTAWRKTPHWAALGATVFTWPLLFIGGLVTTYRVGMAVPDWPTTFGINMFLYDMSQAAWGVFVEHGHRLYGAAVGLGCLGLALYYTLAAGRQGWRPLVVGLLGVAVLAVAARASGHVDPLMMGIVTAGPVSLALAGWFGLGRRNAIVASSWLLLAAVIGQGSLGGFRVRWNSTDLAAIHGCTGQLFFAAMVAFCVVSGRVWSEARPASTPDRFGLRWSATALAILVYLQIVAGAWLRHYSLGLTVHSILAAAVFVGAHLVALPAIRLRSTAPELRPSARALLLLTTVQLVLGLLSWWLLRPFDGIAKEVTTPQALVRTAHQANGALVLAASVVLALRARRHLAGSTSSVPTRYAEASAPPALEGMVR